MPTLMDALAPEGALVDILLGLSASQVKKLHAALMSVPAPVSSRALIDTGAEITCVDGALIQTANLTIHGTTLSNLPAHGGINISLLYDASLTIVHPSGNPSDNLVIRNLPVLEVPLAPLGYQVLIGRDVLAKCAFLYYGLKNRFRLSY